MSDRRTKGAAPAGPVQWLFWPALILALVILAVFSVIDAPLQTPAATKGIASGIVAYELAGSTPAAQAMIDSWDARGGSTQPLVWGWIICICPAMRWP